MIIAIIIAVVLIGGAILYAGSSSGSAGGATLTANAVSIIDGKQVIEIMAKGGYSPRQVSAKAGVPTVLRLKTNGTFDCSAGVVIPSLGVRETLPSTGNTDIEVPPQALGSVLEGRCVMGMYTFAITFD